MWQCKECGKKYSAEPIYCDFCGATENFLEPVDVKENESFYRGVEAGFQNNLANKDFDDYDKLIKDFLADEYQPISRKVKEPFEDEMLEKEKRQRREKRLESLDNEYYESIKTVVGTESIEKDDYYKDLEDLFKEPLQGGDQTTFNGIFKKEDTIENTFLKPRNKKGRSVVENKIKANSPKKRLKIPISIPIPMIGSAKKKKDGFSENPKDERKLLKIIAILGSVFALMIVLMVIVLGNIVDSGDESGKLPSEETMLSFFTDIKAIDEASYLENPIMISFMEYEGTNVEKQEMLKILYAMVTSEQLVIQGVNKIDQKGINRVLVTYAVSGDDISKDTLDQLLFRTNDNITYQLDFTDFVTQYTIAKGKYQIEE
jgi:hypothetical protein